MRKIPRKQEITDSWGYHGVEIEYENNRDNCTCDMICRCSKIVNEKVISVDVHKMAEELCYDTDKFENENYEYDPISYLADAYCIERILVSNKVYDPNNWVIYKSNWYYGEEIDGVCLKKEIAEKINKEIEQMRDPLATIGLDEGTIDEWLSAQLSYVLNLEYGYITDIIVNKKIVLMDIDKKDIVFGNEDHYKKLDKEIVEKYRNTEDHEYKLFHFDFPRGIVRLVNGKYRIIDGYHRIAAADKKLSVFVVLDDELTARKMVREIFRKEDRKDLKNRQSNEIKDIEKQIEEVSKIPGLTVTSTEYWDTDK